MTLAERINEIYFYRNKYKAHLKRKFGKHWIAYHWQVNLINDSIKRGNS